MAKLIIIRGNSGSGKSTVAKQLQQEMGYETMLVQQDVLRREILRVRDKPGNPAIELIHDTAAYGRSIGYDVIVEGILTRERYGEMLQRLSSLFDETHVYYFDIPFEETVRRHHTKPNAHEYGEKELKEWWNERDLLSDDDTVITHDLGQAEIVSRIVKDVQATGKKLL